MPLTFGYDSLEECKFDYPFRIFISGSSQSGKTYFARELLSHSDIFKQQIGQIKYYHPDYLSTRPVDWHKSLSIPISYQSGVPTLEQICELDPHTCVVLDDLYEECINSKAIDYLFRVVSGKHKISVIIMSQRYFAQGRFGLNIRNNCNFTVLMRNADARVNTKIASLINQKVAITRAMKDNYSRNYYPYIFIDSSPRGQVSNYRCYTDIFSDVQAVYCHNGMKAFIIREHDFLANFDIINKKTAKRKNGQHSKIEPRERNKSECSASGRSDTESESDSSGQQCQGQRAGELRKRRFGRNIHQC